MTKLKNLLLDGNQPCIAVVVTDQEINEDIVKQGIDVLEIRVDLFQDLDKEHIQENIQQRQKTGIPLILTVRTDSQEGAEPHNGISEDFKCQIFENCISLIDAVDIELTSPILSKVIALARKHQKTIIISSHNFNTTPQKDVLESILTQAKEKKADIIKIAAMAHSLDDVRMLAAFTIRHRDEEIITMSLGEKGAISRLAFPAMGTLLTYSYIGKPSAPGQIPLKTLQEHLKVYYS